MATILAISSEVVRGHVGNAAARFVLQRLGHTVWSMPTVILSNHPGHAHTAGTRTPSATLSAMLEALANNGWLAEVDAVMTGYLPSPEHVAFAATAIERVRAQRADVLVLCDPVMGDDPEGLYIDEAAAVSVRDNLLPLAHILTPNRFELQWLSGIAVDAAEAVADAAKQFAPAIVLATSIPGASQNSLSNVLVNGSGRSRLEPVIATVPRHPFVPHGTGDMLAALLLGHLLFNDATTRAAPERLTAAFRAAVAGVTHAIDASLGQHELDLAGSQSAWGG